MFLIGCLGHCTEVSLSHSVSYFYNNGYLSWSPVKLKYLVLGTKSSNLDSSYTGKENRCRQWSSRSMMPGVTTVRHTPVPAQAPDLPAHQSGSHDTTHVCSGHGDTCTSHHHITQAAVTQLTIMLSSSILYPLLISGPATAYYRQQMRWDGSTQWRVLLLLVTVDIITALTSALLSMISNIK